MAVLVAFSGCGDGDDDADPGAQSGTTETTPSTGAGTTQPPAGTEFRDAKGRYSLRIGESWDKLPASATAGVGAEVEAWAVGAAVDGFTPNVNVLVQEFSGSTPQDYITYTGKGGGGVVVERGEVITLPDGTPAARFVLSQENEGKKLFSLGIAVTKRGSAALATLTTPEADFERYSKDVEPLLQTLRLLNS